MSRRTYSTFIGISILTLLLNCKTIRGQEGWLALARVVAGPDVMMRMTTSTDRTAMKNGAKDVGWLITQAQVATLLFYGRLRRGVKCQGES